MGNGTVHNEPLIFFHPVPIKKNRIRYMTSQPRNGRTSARLTARSGGLPIAVKEYSVRGHKAYHTALIASLLLLLVAGVSVDAQSRKSGRQEPRGGTVASAVSVPPTAERRTAVVIGNSFYAEGPLANPVNDATDMANALQQMGFAVTPLLNADLLRMRDAIETFRK